jgi:cytidine deaminase
MQLGLKIPTNLEGELLRVLQHPDFSGDFNGVSGHKASTLECLLELAREFASAPISGFKVGALAIGKSGKGYLGANMEFTGVPLHASLHAEQSAVINAWMHGESGIESLTVSELPCGHCRQFLLELHGAAELPIRANGHSKNLAALMPEPFAQTRSKGRGLLDSPAQKLIAIQTETSDHAKRAINAASRSYTPYSQSPEGFMIEMIDGHHFAGRAAESVAFNPSVPAIITALNQLNLSARRRVAISRCTHAKLATALTHSLAFSAAVMRGICSVPIESVLMETDA